MSSNFLPKDLGSLTRAQLLEKVRDLQNLAYQLGLEEGMELENIRLSILSYFCYLFLAHEMTRGKMLNILSKKVNFKFIVTGRDLGKNLSLYHS